MRIRACIFDLDGTLLETREAIARAVNAVLEANGLAPQPADKFGYFTGNGIDTAVKRALARLEGAPRRFDVRLEIRA